MFIPLVMALSSMSEVAMPFAAHAPSVDSNRDRADVRNVEFRIESKALLEQQAAEAAEETVYFVRTDGTNALTNTHGVSVSDAGGNPQIVVYLSWVDYAESIYGIRIETIRPGEEPVTVESFECECADSELARAVVTRLPKALEALESAPAPAPAVDEPGEPVGSLTPAVHETQDDERMDRVAREPLGRVGIAGIGVTAVGVATLIGGGIVFSRGQRTESATGAGEERDQSDFRPPGTALMVTGGVAAVTGVALIVADLLRSRSRRAARIIPSTNGLVVLGRF